MEMRPWGGNLNATGDNTHMLHKSNFLKSLSVAAFAFSLAVCMLAAGGARAQMAPQPERPAGSEIAIFAGGCFWCMEGPFDKIDGVFSTTSGYIGGKLVNPTYEQVSRGGTGHTEGLAVVYDPKKVSYAKLLDVFWRNIDPFVKDRQFCDVGSQYRSGIFVSDDAQRSAAEASLKQVQDKFAGKTIYTEITKASMFYPAEEYHQDFYLKNPPKYKFYRWNCGRDQRLKAIWGAEAEH